MTSAKIVNFPLDRVSPGLELEDPATVLNMAEAREIQELLAKIKMLEAKLAKLEAEFDAETARLRRIIERAGLSADPEPEIVMPQTVGTIDPLGED